MGAVAASWWGCAVALALALHRLGAATTPAQAVGTVHALEDPRLVSPRSHVGSHSDSAPSAGALTLDLHATRLLVGVKSAVLSGAAARETIRQTWANPSTRPRDVAVVFLGCEPHWAALNLTKRDRSHAENAITAEKTAHGDLLTHELGCVDSYWTLVEKVQGFFKWTTTTPVLAALAYVMVVDDDVYVDLHALAANLLRTIKPIVPRRRGYAGEVIHTQFNVTLRPIRDPREKNYLPSDVYPLDEKPPFATGAHYILSVDLVHFLGHNHDRLRGVGTLEDVSVAFWLLTLLRVRPVHLPQFNNVRYTLCYNSLLAYADISHVAMQRIHRNLLRNGSFCDGFAFAVWDKRERYSPPVLPVSSLTGAGRTRRFLRHHWDAHFHPSRGVLYLTATISTDTREPIESAVTIYTATKDSIVEFCLSLIDNAHRSLPTTAIPLELCAEHRALMAGFITSSVAADPATSAVYALPLMNLMQDAISSAVFVHLLPSLSASRTLVECLIAASLAGAHINLQEPLEFEQHNVVLPPDLVFLTAEDTWHPPQRGSRVEVHQPRRIVFQGLHMTGFSSPLECDGEVICIISHRDRALCTQKSLYIPLASQSFARRLKHSPMALLEPRATSITKSERAVLVGWRRRDAVAASVASVLHRLLKEADFGVQNLHAGHKYYTLDDECEHYSQIAFVVVVEERLDIVGHISDQIVTAFLAGAIPIYYGHSATIRWLFNPHAFVDCGTFSTLRACIQYVNQVAASPSLVKAIKSQAPVVNMTAFVEVFSWHPLVIEMAQRRGYSNQLLLGERLRSLINSS